VCILILVNKYVIQTRANVASNLHTLAKFVRAGPPAPPHCLGGKSRILRAILPRPYHATITFCPSRPIGEITDWPSSYPSEAHVSHRSIPWSIWLPPTWNTSTPPSSRVPARK